jgi:hypothetical protein
MSGGSALLALTGIAAGSALVGATVAKRKAAPSRGRSSRSPAESVTKLMEASTNLANTITRIRNKRRYR